MQDLPVEITKSWITPVAGAWIEHGVRILIILIGGWLSLYAGDVISKRIIDKAKDRLDQGASIRERVQTVAGVLKNLYRYAILFTASMMILAEMGVNLGPLLAGAGILGLAIGFGSQELVKDVIAGYFILIEAEFGVGDVIRVGDKAGGVERLGLRNIKIVAFDGSSHIIPNSEVGTVHLMSRGFARALLKIGVSYDSDMAKVTQALTDYGQKLKAELDFILDEPEVLDVSDLKDSAVEFYFAVKVKPGNQWKLERRMRREIITFFRERGIEIPYPHMVNIVRGEIPAHIADSKKISTQEQPEVESIPSPGPAPSE